MIDREKVIKGWECHMEADTLGCADCPYRQGWRTCNFADTLFKDVYALLKVSVPQGVVDQIRWERDTALSQLKEIGKGLGSKMDDIVTMLKEQEAIEPTLTREGRNKHYNDYVCPRCDNEVVYEQNYCSECGVQFLWEDR